MEDIINLQLGQVLTAYIFVVILLVFVRWKKVGHQAEIVLASIRMTVQLVLMGFILEYVIINQSPLYTLTVLGLMELFAIRNVFSRLRNFRLTNKFKQILATSLFSGTLISIIYFILVVVRLRPWYLSQYFIPLTGMLIGNSMTGISLGAERLLSGFKENGVHIENALMLGATPKQAAGVIVSRAFYAALLPTINSMLGMGIIFLPGMMTGQILAGTNPVVAIKYQIAIMLGILGSVTLSVFMLVHRGYRVFFNQRQQLISDK